DDHRRPARLAAELARIPGVALRSAVIETNMVFFDVAEPGNEAFLAALRDAGIRMGVLGDGVIRAVVHYMIDDDAISRTVDAVRAIVLPFAPALAPAAASQAQ
ncbi:threonine aldolase, partial [Burkholderia pseudomallei]